MIKKKIKNKKKLKKVPLPLDIVLDNLRVCSETLWHRE